MFERDISRVHIDRPSPVFRTCVLDPVGAELDAREQVPLQKRLEEARNTASPSPISGR